MSAHAMNSQEWWDAYFKDQWDAHDGRNQTRGFMRTLLLNLPESALSYLLTTTLTALDWGCAKGDGVDVLATAFPSLTVSGLDFSKDAIAAAQSHFPRYTFIQTDDGAIPGEYDVICTSNCLEHFARPLDIASAHLQHCRQLYIALVPYNEHPLFEQHEAQFREESFPEHLGDFVRIACLPIDVPAIYWPDQQLLAIYAHRDYAQQITVASHPTSSADIARFRERLLSEEESILYAELGNLHRQVNQMWHHEVGPRDTQISELKHAYADLEARVGVAEADRERLAKRLGIWREKAVRFRKQRDYERDRASKLTKERDAYCSERDAYWSQTQFMASTKAWKLTNAYWRLRGKGIVGWFLLFLIGLSAIIASPLIVALLILRLLYKVLVPYRVRIRVHTWRKRAFARRPSRAQLMSLYSYAFVRYKQKRATVSPTNVTSLRTPSLSGQVSVILPVYNGADMLRESLASILNQTYQNFEVIAINDGSTDGSGEVLEEYARLDGRIRVFHQENRKIPRTLSRGARIAQGEFLTWTSCDNHMKPDFLEQLVGSLTRHPDWDMVYANIDIIGENGEPLRNSEWYEGYQRPPHSEHVYFPTDIADLNVYPNNYVGSAFMYRSRAAWLLGDYSFIRFTTEDYDYWMRMNSLLTLRHADFDTPIYEYRFHTASLTARDKELGITASRANLMAFEDFRRDFQLAPLIWVVEGGEESSAARSTVARFKKLASDKGHLLFSATDLARYHLPQRWAPTVYVQVASTSSAALQPPVSLPQSTLRALIVPQDQAMAVEEDPASEWDMCVTLTNSAKLHRIGDGYVGWYGCADLATAFAAIDIRARSHHELLIEQEIARSQTQPVERKVSVVICAYKRTERVLQAVRSLAYQTMSQAEYEVIVVNNDASDRTLIDRLAEARQAWFPERPDCLRYVENPIQGLSNARNAGISEATGEVVSFLDDDAVAPSTWVAHTWAVFSTHPEIGVLGGHIHLKTVVPAPEALQPGLETYWSEYRTSHEQLTIVNGWHEYPWGANWSARRLALLHVGGFRTRYGRLGGDYNGGEEIVAASLIRSIGYQIAVSPDSEVLHDVETTRYTWKHIEQTEVAGALSQYMMELDLYIPVSMSLSTSIQQAMNPQISPNLRSGRVRRKLRAYRRRAYRRLAQEQWRHRRIRRVSALAVIESIRARR